MNVTSIKESVLSPLQEEIIYLGWLCVVKSTFIVFDMVKILFLCE